MEEVLFPNISELAIVRRDLRKYRLRCLREVTLASLVLSKNCGPLSDECVNKGHFWGKEGGRLRVIRCAVAGNWVVVTGGDGG